MDPLNNLSEQQKWAEAIALIGQHKKHIPAERLQWLCPKLLDTLRIWPCQDRVITLRIILTYARYLRSIIPRHLSYSELNGYLKLWDLSTDLPHKFTVWVLQPTCVLSVSQRSVHSWPDSVPAPADVYGPTPAGVAWMALNSGQWKLLSVLMQYGFWSGEVDNQGLMMTGVDGVYSEFRDVCLYIGSVAERFTELRFRTRGLWQGLFESDGRMRNGNQRGFRRIILITRMLKGIALQPQQQETYAYIQCLRLYFAALPDPLVSTDEVEEFLLYFLTDVNDRHVVDRLVGQFVATFGRQTYGPRSLAHLSRCTVKNSLAKNKSATLPKHVEALNVPGTLKDFLLGAPERTSW